MPRFRGKTTTVQENSVRLPVCEDAALLGAQSDIGLDAGE